MVSIPLLCFFSSYSSDYVWASSICQTNARRWGQNAKEHRHSLWVSNLLGEDRWERRQEPECKVCLDWDAMVCYAMRVKVPQSCPTLCNPMDYTVHGILQARILEWVAFPFSRGSSKSRDRTQVSHIAGDSLPAESPGKPKNTGVGSLPFSSGSSQPRNWSRVSCIAHGFFTNWAIREAYVMLWQNRKWIPPRLEGHRKLPEGRDIQDETQRINYWFYFLFFLAIYYLCNFVYLRLVGSSLSWATELEVQNPNHWTARKFPHVLLFLNAQVYWCQSQTWIHS